LLRIKMLCINFFTYKFYNVDFELQAENSSPGDFPLSVYRLLIVQTKVRRSSVCWRRNKRKLSVCKRTERTCPSTRLQCTHIGYIVHVCLNIDLPKCHIYYKHWFVVGALNGGSAHLSSVLDRHTPWLPSMVGILQNFLSKEKHSLPCYDKDTIWELCTETETFAPHETLFLK
jgi:hypothetical protein